MKKYRFRLFKAPKNDPIDKGRESTEEMTRGQILKLKRSLRKDKKIKFKITMLEGEKEPLLPIETIQRLFK